MSITRFAVALCLLVTLSGISQTTPTAEGVYIQSADTWTKLFVATSSGVRTDGAGKAMLTFGAGSLKSVITYRDSEAPVKVSSARPVIEVVGPLASAPRDILIVRMQQKKDHRELVIGKANAYTGMKMEYSAGDTTEVDVAQQDGKTTITPRQELKPGEYIIFLSTTAPVPVGYGGYDFSVRR